MGKALQIRQKAADSPQGLTARRWPALLALARKAAGPYGEDVAAWLAVPEAQAEPCLLELAQCLSRLTMRNVDDLAPLTLDSLRPLCDLTRHCEDALGSWQAEEAAAGLQALAALLDTLETGVCRMERDGISHTCPARFALVGTMNPSPGTPACWKKSGPGSVSWRSAMPVWAAPVSATCWTVWNGAWPRTAGPSSRPPSNRLWPMPLRSAAAWMRPCVPMIAPARPWKMP